jgi:hypothetical protein
MWNLDHGKSSVVIHSVKLSLASSLHPQFLNRALYNTALTNSYQNYIFRQNFAQLPTTMSDNRVGDHAGNSQNNNGHIINPAVSNASAVNNPATTNTSLASANQGVASSAPAGSAAQQAPLNPGLYAPDPATPFPRDLSVFEIATILMNPPQEFRLSPGMVTIDIDWAVGKAGRERFEMSLLDHRLSLVQTDELYSRGEEVGISTEVLKWLRGGKKTLELPASHFGQ